MRQQRPWPVRYRVTLWSAPHESVGYDVVTWLYDEKAVALAVAAHLRTTGRTPADVTVEALGDAPADAKGLVAVGSDLHDRMEF